MTVREFRLPDPGEGLTEAEIVSWRVAVGDTLAVNDVVVEVETAKSLVELPTPYAGTVTGLLVDEGALVEVGTPIIAIDTPVPAGGDAAVPPGDRPAPVEAPPSAPTGSAGDGAVPTAPADSGGSGRTAVLVGYGVKTGEAKRRPRRKDVLLRTIAAPPGPHVDPEVSARVGGLVAAHASDVPRDVRPVADLAQPHGAVVEHVPVLAKPPVRGLAKDLGVDLATVAPTGPGGTVSEADVRNALVAETPVASPARQSPATPAAYPTVSAASPVAPTAREERIPIKGVRRLTAAAMVESAFTAPHVTEWVSVDVTATMDLVARLKKDREFADVKVTPLLVLAKAMCVAMRRNPGVNAVWDEAAQEIVVKHYVNLGIAAATPRGLIVPNIKDADRLTLRELAIAIETLTATAREGRAALAQLSGGTVTITNIGVFGIDGGTPIINPGESAIMSFGSIRRMPWVVEDDGGSERIEARWVTQLALAFDHRLVDGELGSRYLADVAALLHDPAQALVWG
jgi:pyruvate dehydrogenase E2 component (dihydrolipoamide acetyltransferase)